MTGLLPSVYSELATFQLTWVVVNRWRILKSRPGGGRVGWPPAINLNGGMLGELTAWWPAVLEKRRSPHHLAAQLDDENGWL